MLNNLYLTLLSKILNLARNKSKAVTKRAGTVRIGSGRNRLSPEGNDRSKIGQT